MNPSTANQNQQATHFSDLDLVKKSLENIENFGLIIERYESKLLRYLIYFTGMGKESAEDVLQETFIKVFRKLNSFNQNLSFSSWIFRIAHNEAINYLKKHKNKLTISLDAEDDQSLSLINILASDENIAKKAASNETSSKVRAALLHLRADYREVLILKYLENYNLNEISDILKKPLGTVGVLIMRAKAAFKKLAEKFNLTEYEQN